MTSQTPHSNLKSYNFLTPKRATRIDGYALQSPLSRWRCFAANTGFIGTALAVVLCLCPLQVAALGPDSAKVIVGRWRAAIHQPTKLHSDTIELVRMNNADGLQSVEQVWISHDARFRELIDRRHDDSTVVVAASEAWYRDWNGHVRPLAGEQLQRLKTQIFEETTIAFGPSSQFESAQVRQDEASSNYVLSVAVKDGKPITFFVDSRTFLPVKSVRPADEADLTTEYSNWRKGPDGIRLPYLERLKNAEASDSVLVLKKAGPLKDRSIDWGKPGSVPDGRMITNNGHQAVVPFNFENRHIMVSCRLNGSPAMWCLVDTGAEASFINATRLASFGIKPYGESKTTGGGGSTESRFGFPANFDIGGVELKDQHVGVLDLGGLESVYGMKMGAILGYDFLSRFVTEIDYEKSTLTLHDPAIWSYAGHGYIIPLEFDNGIPNVDGRISVRGDSIRARFIVDFGAADTLNFTSPFVASHQLLQLAGTSSTVNRMAGSEKQFFTQTTIRGKIDALTIDDLSLRDIPVNLSVAQKGAYASTRFSAGIGETIFSRFHVFLDYPNQRMILEPTSASQKSFPRRSTYGLTILASGDDLRRYTVTGVRAGSPAERQGFRAGDLISEIDGGPASSHALGDLKSFFNDEGRVIAVRVSRDSGTETLPVVVSLIPIDSY